MSPLLANVSRPLRPLDRFQSRRGKHDACSQDEDRDEKFKRDIERQWGAGVGGGVFVCRVDATIKTLVYSVDNEV